MMAREVMLQASVCTFAPNTQHTTVLGTLNYETGAVMVVGKPEFSLRRLSARGVDAIFATDNPRADGFDMLFSQDQVADAIAAFRRLQSMSLLTLGDKVKALDPAFKIETDGLDERGKPKLRVAQDIANGHMAILALVLLASLQVEHGDAAGNADALFEVVSVGFGEYTGAPSLGGTGGRSPFESAATSPLPIDWRSGRPFC